MQNDNGRDHVLEDKIKGMLDIVEVVRKSCSLDPDSDGKYRGATSALSKSGKSLIVDRSMQVYNNFANGDSGDVFDWIGYVNGLKTRGKDFPEVLRIAADMAGVPLENRTPEEKEREIERQNVRNTLTKAAELYHENLTPEIREYIKTKWGITDETMDRIKIGYARPVVSVGDANLYRKIPDEDLLKSGLILLNKKTIDSEDKGERTLPGRVVFPYWNNGKGCVTLQQEVQKEIKRTT